MCRNIRLLFNFDPPTTEDEIRAAAIQYVRKVSGTRKPSKVNEAAFERAIEAVTAATRALLGGLETHAPPHSREVEAARAKMRGARRQRSSAA
ncbi:MAG: DUF2277 domain-containing protein [Byssovorax sp.]